MLSNTYTYDSRLEKVDSYHQNKSKYVILYLSRLSEKTREFNKFIVITDT